MFLRPGFMRSQLMARTSIQGADVESASYPLLFSIVEKCPLPCSCLLVECAPYTRVGVAKGSEKDVPETQAAENPFRPH